MEPKVHCTPSESYGEITQPNLAYILIVKSRTNEWQTIIQNMYEHRQLIQIQTFYTSILLDLGV